MIEGEFLDYVDKRVYEKLNPLFKNRLQQQFKRTAWPYEFIGEETIIDIVDSSLDIYQLGIGLDRFEWSVERQLYLPKEVEILEQLKTNKQFPGYKVTVRGILSLFTDDNLGIRYEVYSNLDKVINVETEGNNVNVPYIPSITKGQKIQDAIEIMLDYILSQK